MPKVTSFFDEQDAPELRFEEPENAHHKTPKRAASYAAAITMPAVGVSPDSAMELKQKQAMALKLQQELDRTQREARELELRQQKEDRFHDGRRDMCERLSRGLAKLDRELHNSQKAVEEISVAREVYQHHLDTLRNISPEAIKQTHDEDTLDHAVGAVEDAEAEFAKANHRLASVMPGVAQHVGAPGGLPQDFGTWFRMGFAFTLPLAIIAMIFTYVLKYL
jgi:DNA repair exonuclease SbcCD ATPase subunit